MSLNGLEAVEVNEAYQSALSEGGRWSDVPNGYGTKREADKILAGSC